MANYKETSTSGTKWTRCETVTIRNPLGGIPEALFIEEDILQIGDTKLHQSTGAISKVFSSEDTFPIIDPSTGNTIGSMSHAELYVALYSLYMQTAIDRDNTLAQA